MSDHSDSQARVEEAQTTTETETTTPVSETRAGTGRSDERQTDERETEGPSVAGMLSVAVELLGRGRLPEPVCVQASGQFGLEFDIGTHAQLMPWLEVFGFVIEPWRTMPFEWAGVMHTLTTASGLWCGTPVTVRCCEPVDVPAVLRGDGEPS
ncbi:hypothetical protein K1W54_27315 [Micromonospora sp. CPCC 205371]|nr:hypothetical protein [Micromonospora sp. CPCC 205371]